MGWPLSSAGPQGSVGGGEQIRFAPS